MERPLSKRKWQRYLALLFFDLDAEIESYFGTTNERLQNRFLTPYSYRKETTNALKHLLSGDNSKTCVIALPPSGLMDSYWLLFKNLGATIIVLEDSPENILNRIVFYDIDSKVIDKHLSENEKRLYLKEIKGDISYFKRIFRRANMAVDIACLGPDDAAPEVCQALNQYMATQSAPEPEQGVQRRTSSSSFASAGQ